VTPLIVAAALVAGAAGAVARFAVGHAVRRMLGTERATRAVLLVNIAASLAAGIAIALPEDSATRYIVLGGFAAGLSTFSTWTVETIQLVLERRSARAARNVVANLVWGGAACAAGFGIALLLGLPGA
jgi:CrcB protein